MGNQYRKQVNKQQETAQKRLIFSYSFKLTMGGNDSKPLVSDMVSFERICIHMYNNRAVGVGEAGAA